MNDKEKLISLLILTDPNPYICESESESGSCELTTCTECWARSTAELLIANGVTVQEWISVDDRLPEEDGYYLCCIKSSLFPDRVYIDILECDKGSFEEGHIYTDTVTHWMPLPSTEGLK